VINIRTTNDVLNGVIKVFDNSNLDDTFNKGIIKIQKLGLSKELDSGTTPTLSSFLSPNSLTGVEFDARIDEIVEVEYTLLSALSNSGLSYTLGDNMVYQVGIYNTFSGTDKIFIDQLYTIDKTKSGADFLYLTSPIDNSATTLYKAYYIKKCVVVLFKIPDAIKDLLFSASDCCGYEDGKTLCKVLQYYEGLKIQQDCNDCEKLRSFLAKLKSALNIC
jgi:hypothetical protein